MATKDFTTGRLPCVSPWPNIARVIQSICFHCVLIVPVSDQSSSNNNRSISLLCNTSKVLESLVYNRIIGFLADRSTAQHEFTMRIFEKVGQRWRAFSKFEWGLLKITSETQIIAAKDKALAVRAIWFTCVSIV